MNLPEMHSKDKKSSSFPVLSDAAFQWQHLIVPPFAGVRAQIAELRPDFSEHFGIHWNSCG